MSNTKTRKSNFELLRILSMILIVMSHADDFLGLYPLYSETVGVNKIITDFLNMGGQIGVGCFLLISGYFMIEQKITLKKILKLAGEVWTYTIGIFVAWLLFIIIKGHFPVNQILIELKYAVFPILTCHYWFVSAYIILMILSVFINPFILSLDKKTYTYLLTALIGIFVVLQGGIPTVLDEMSRGRIVPVIIMYFIAGYIRRFKEKRNNAKKHFKVALFTYLLLLAVFYVTTFIAVTFDVKTLYQYIYFYRVLNSPFVVIISVELFIGTLETDIPYNKLINTIAASTFGVYLLHTNRLVNLYLPSLFKISTQTNSLLIFIYSILSVLAIYIVLTIVSFIRNITVGKLYNSFLDKHLGSIENKLMEKVANISSKVKTRLDNYYNN